VNTACANIDAIVLAAGNSSRFGSDKRLFAVGDETMLQRSVSAVAGAVRHVFVVLKASDADSVQALLGKHQENPWVMPLFVVNPHRGMGSNLASAISQLPADTDAVLVMLGDMPFVQVQTVHAIVGAGRRDAIVAPFCEVGGQLQRGHPVLFGRNFFPEMLLLQGDQGARAVVQKYPGSLLQLRVQDQGVLQDLDVLPA
jgi:molybdenum cofactor cytidylyltransferase